MLNRQDKKPTQLNNSLEHLKAAKDNIYKQATMAGLAIVVTLVLVFAMAVAWYSNVIHTEGLVFEASSWDFEFEGEVVIQAENHKAAPGESGIVTMKLENKSDDAITVLVNATKNTGFTDDMKKRIYFYVDDSQTKNEEIMNRVYINETDSYAYTILGQNLLTLNEEYHSDPYLKWEWVYDVLGYYVNGTIVDGNMVVADYMKPVVYDYEDATFTPEGKLMTADGLSAKDYIQSLFDTDGYQGNEVKEPVNGYYPVVVDEQTNSGIWLYLCNQAEIEQATNWDTLLSQVEDPNPFTARLILSGERKPNAQMTVSDETELATQLNAEGVDKVVVNSNMTLQDALVLADDRDVVLDLNQYTLTLPAKANGIEVSEGSRITIVNGVIDGAGSTAAAIKTTGSDVVMNNVEIKNVKRGVLVEDDKGNGNDSRVKITNSKLETTETAVMIRGNGNKSAAKTSVLLEKSTIISDYMSVAGNGTYGGTDMEIIQCTLEGKWAGIYHPQADSSLSVLNSTIKGYTAIAIKAGDVKLVDTAVQGTGAKGEPAFAKSGFTDTGDGIYIETNYEKPISLDISGSKTYVSSVYSNAIQVYDPEATHVDIVITGGKFSTDITQFVPEGYTAKFIDPYYEVALTPASEN